MTRTYLSTTDKPSARQCPKHVPYRTCNSASTISLIPKPSQHQTPGRTNHQGLAINTQDLFGRFQGLKLDRGRVCGPQCPQNNLETYLTVVEMIIFAIVLGLGEEFRADTEFGDRFESWCARLTLTV